MKTKLFIMLLSCICLTAVASEAQDSIQTSKQRQSVQRKASKEQLYDINGDGVVNIVDVTVLIDYILYGDKEEKSYTECPDENHPHAIDLGLPSGTKWSCCNVGASVPEDYGNYYAWGETQPKSVYNWETYQHGYYNYDGDYSHLVNIGNDIAGTEYDAATANWDAPWRMPSLVQCQELLNNCSSEWTTQNGVNGRKFTGPSGGTIFLPAAGYRWNGELYGAGSYGFCWSSTLNESGPYSAYALRFYSGLASWYYYFDRYDGQSVRPVR